MAFRENNVVITSANVIDVVANGIDGDVYTGTDSADAFVIADGAVGDDLLSLFSDNDSIITHSAIFDGNGDGYIAFGPGAQLDVDRFGSGDSRKGNDNLSVLGAGNARVTEIRYLGFKADEVGTKNHVYADSGTRDALLGRFDKGFQDGVTTGADSSITQAVKIDNDVSSNTFDFGTQSVALLTDNALGVNFGGDTINGFGDDDLLVFTSAIHNRNDVGTGDSANTVTFGKNLVLDLSGANGPLSSDPTTGPGGQFDLNAPNQVSIYYLGEKTINGTSYYYYGTDDAATPTGVTYA